MLNVREEPLTSFKRLIEENLPKGQHIEVYGKPGAGKTALWYERTGTTSLISLVCSLQLALNVLRRDSKMKICWVGMSVLGWNRLPKPS